MLTMCRKDKRKDILAAAMELFAEQGFHGAPMAMIAERAKVGAGTIYRYFENKDILIEALYRETYDRLKDFLLDGYPFDRPIRERFFHMMKRLIAYYKDCPLECRYTEQFHNSPYGLSHRKEKLLNLTGEYDFIHAFFEEGRDQQVFKDVPMAVYFVLSFAPVIWALKDHHAGFVNLDDALADVIVCSCWNSLKI
jgi:AcrR family transcriptional regulator